MADEHQRCAVCSRPIESTESIAEHGGVAVHLACLVARKPGTRAAATAGLFKNTRDARGLPVCPVCARSIDRRDPAARAGVFMVHIECLAEARQSGVGQSSS